MACEVGAFSTLLSGAVSFGILDTLGTGFYFFLRGAKLFLLSPNAEVVRSIRTDVSAPAATRY